MNQEEVRSEIDSSERIQYGGSDNDLNIRQIETIGNKLVPSPRNRHKDARKDKKQHNKEKYGRFVSDELSQEVGKMNVQNYQYANSRPPEHYETDRFQESLDNSKR